ncbi:hypothetical protein ACHAXN_004242 [Cyclotella atomus]
MSNTVQTLIPPRHPGMNPLNKVSDAPEAVVSSCEADTSPLTAAASKQYATPKRIKLQNTVTPGTEGGMPGNATAENEKISSKEQIVIPPTSNVKEEPDAAVAPSINLGPRLTGGKSPARAISLMPRKSPSDASSKENVEASKTASGNAAKRNLGSAMKKGKAQGAAVMPAPSQFLAAKISPLRSSARIKKRDSPRPASQEHVEAPAPSRSPLPDIAKADLLSPCGMFLTPRTPSRLNEARGAASAGATAPLTPSNFASDFGKGSTVEGIDSNGVFAWLHSPTMLGANGLFSPNGGLAQSLTNTPRGMYGFSGKTPYTPSTAALAPASSSTFFFEGEATKDDKNSMICISPLASQKKAGANTTSTPNPTDSVLNTPMSIDFTKVFATPRLPTPRMYKTGFAAKKDIQTPVLSTMERNIIDEDLNAMLQLAEKTPNGTRSIGFMSPLLTNSIRKMGAVKSEHPDESLSDLQLPIISGRPGVSRLSPQLTVRSSSVGSADKQGKKRKAGDEYPPHTHSYPQPPHASMLHYRQGAPPPPGYYPHPPPAGYPMSIPHQPHHRYPAPPQHYGYDRKATPPTDKPEKSKRKAAKNAKAVIKRAVADDGSFTPSPPKKPKKSPSKPRRPKSKNALPDDPLERARVAEAIRAVNANSGGNNDKAAELAAAIMRGVTCRPSGKWQAQLYYSGKSRYIGVFDSREKAALAYEIAREVLKEDKGDGPLPQEVIDKNVSLARQAAFAGVNGTPTS